MRVLQWQRETRKQRENYNYGFTGGARCWLGCGSFSFLRCALAEDG